jgi:epoxyqueuosine reductase
MGLSDDIKCKARQLGLDLVGVTDASPIDSRQVELLTGWLASGFAGQMDYMHRNLEKRINPAKLLENAQSVVVVGLSYKAPSQNQSATTPPAGRVASYAQYEDYHPFLKTMLRRLTVFISSLAGAGHKFNICVDSAPVAERALATRAGLGFIGKNHMLINPTLGPQIFLGEIITTVKLQFGQPAYCHSERSEAKSRNLLPETRAASAEQERIESTSSKCAGCTKCIDACPTGALRADGQFDANKCISYLTIEHKGQIPPELAEKIGNRLFGCDECVQACPYQQKSPVCRNKEFKCYRDIANLNLQQILDMNEKDFEAAFADSVIKRIGLDRLKRNARICLANV